jgi:hypothetical protein
VQGFFKTSQSLTIRALNQDLPIPQFTLVPQPFNFGSSAGSSLTNSSFYAAFDINFTEGLYTIICQGASSLSIGNPYLSDLIDIGSSTKKKHKTSVPEMETKSRNFVGPMCNR